MAISDSEVKALKEKAWHNTPTTLNEGLLKVIGRNIKAIRLSLGKDSSGSPKVNAETFNAATYAKGKHSADYAQKLQSAIENGGAGNGPRDSTARNVLMDMDYLGRVAAVGGKDIAWLLTPHGEEESADDVAATPAAPMSSSESEEELYIPSLQDACGIFVELSKYLNIELLPTKSAIHNEITLRIAPKERLLYLNGKHGNPLEKLNPSAICKLSDPAVSVVRHYYDYAGDHFVSFLRDLVKLSEISLPAPAKKDLAFERVDREDDQFTLDNAEINDPRVPSRNIIDFYSSIPPDTEINGVKVKEYVAKASENSYDEPIEGYIDYLSRTTGKSKREIFADVEKNSAKEHKEWARDMAEMMLHGKVTSIETEGI